MQVPSHRLDEAASVAALRSLQVLDSEPEVEFDALVRAASLACGSPIALISLIDADRQWFKANIGLSGVTETPREVSFCGHAVLGEEVFVVPDAALDPRFADNPLVTGDPSIRFYAGVPIVVGAGHRIGTLCVIDRQARELDASQREILQCLALAAAQALEGRRSTRDLRRSEAFLDRTGRVAGVGGWELDLASGAVTWSDETRRIHGVEPDYQPVLAEAIDFYAIEARPVIQAAVERAVSAGEGWDLELPLVRRDGRHIWVRAVGNVDSDAGQPVRLVGAFQDITQRKELELQLAAASARVLDLYDNAPCGYHSLDEQGRFLHINATALGWLGCTREDLIGKRRAVEFFTPEGQEQFRQNFSRLKSQGRVEGLEFDLVPARGASRRVSITATVINDAEGRFEMSRTVMFDITDLHRTREAVRQLTAEQAAMLDNELIGIVKLRDRRAVWKNRALGRIFGYEHNELLGQQSRMLYLDDESYRALGEAAYPVLNSGGTHRTQLQMRRKDGSPVWIDMSGMVMPTNPDETLWLMVDITPLRQAEELRVRSLELEAENRQLVESSRLKSEFLANMSHELRTPLNAVIGFAQLLASGVVKPESPKYLPYLTQIGASGAHLLQLIESILDFSKAESSKMTFHPEPVDLAGAIQEVIDMLQAKCLSRGVVVTSSVAGAGWLVQVDPLRLRQVLLNLIGNAVKFSHQGGQVTVRAEQQGPESFRIEVEDRGIGIAEADLPKLFKSFHQLSAGNTKTHGGTGIGLALVRRLVELQGGSVGVRSDMGVGSVFHFSLPTKATTLG
ncbi:PAS domain S-box [Burkholderiales bacterium JOSHI_001]|nr:PAS domain S-box [Burkholderiales bacterium JOSHI_001]